MDFTTFSLYNKGEEEIDMKICTGCFTKKHLEEFYKHSNSKDGRAYRCKDCMRFRNKLLSDEDSTSLEEWDRLVRMRRDIHKLGGRSNIDFRDWLRFNIQEGHRCSKCTTKAVQYIELNRSIEDFGSFTIDNIQTTCQDCLDSTKTYIDY